MPPEEAIGHAQAEARRRGWTLIEPAFTIVRARWIFFGALEWHVTGGPGPDGRRVHVVLNGSTGQPRIADQR